MTAVFGEGTVARDLVGGDLFEFAVMRCVVAGEEFTREGTRSLRDPGGTAFADYAAAFFAAFGP